MEWRISQKFWQQQQQQLVPGRAEAGSGFYYIKRKPESLRA
jgi:hypothetical protein